MDADTALLEELKMENVELEKIAEALQAQNKLLKTILAQAEQWFHEEEYDDWPEDAPTNIMLKRMREASA